MFLALAAALAIAVLAFTFLLREQDLPHEAGVSPWKHLEGRKASIYENLRDLQFEYRVGKLSDDDYQRTKAELQAQLVKVLAEIDEMKSAAPASKAGQVRAATSKPSLKKAGTESPYVCVHCGAKFDNALKFCGECGKLMGASA